MKDFLLDGWSRSGTSFKDFAEVISFIDSHTTVLKVNTGAMALLSVDEERTTPETVGLRVHSAERCLAGKGYSPALTTLSVETIKKRDPEGETLINEFLHHSKTMLNYGKHTFFTSNGLPRDLGARAGVSGDAIYIPSEERNLFFSSLYSRKPAESTAVLKTNASKTLYKVFALMSGTYNHVKQKILLDLVDDFEAELGESRCEWWGVNHDITQIVMSFPEKAEDIADMYKVSSSKLPIPCLLLETSDTGASSVTVTALWKMPRGCYVRAESFSRKHSGTITSTEIRDAAHDSIWKSYTKLPERLLELCTIPIADPAAVVEEVFRELKLISYTSLGKRAGTTLLESVMTELDPKMAYSAYDLAMSLMELPTKIRFDGEWGAQRKETIEKVAYKVPFLDWEKLASMTGTVYLVPAI